MLEEVVAGQDPAVLGAEERAWAPGEEDVEDERELADRYRPEQPRKWGFWLSQGGGVWIGSRVDRVQRVEPLLSEREAEVAETNLAHVHTVEAVEPPPGMQAHELRVGS
jgi:hypothetical protein